MNNMLAMDYVGYVTQLGAGSEVVSIGVSLTCPKGGYIEIVNATLRLDDITAGKVAGMVLKNTNLQFIQRQTATLDNSRFGLSTPVMDDKTVSNPNNQGFNLPVIVNGEFVFAMSCDATLDAGKKLYAYIQYKTKFGLMPTIEALGAGITLTDVVNKSV